MAISSASSRACWRRDRLFGTQTAAGPLGDGSLDNLHGYELLRSQL